MSAVEYRVLEDYTRAMMRGQSNLAAIANQKKHYSLSRVVIKIASTASRLFYYKNKTCDFYNYPAKTVMLSIFRALLDGLQRSCQLVVSSVHLGWQYYYIVQNNIICKNIFFQSHLTHTGACAQPQTR